MIRLIRRLLLSMLLLASAQAHAAKSFTISPSVGDASITNVDGYNDAGYFRVDGAFHPLPQLGLNLFATDYLKFESKSGGSVAIKVSGYGAGAIVRWPLTRHVMPYARADYMLWHAEAEGLGRTLGEEDGASTGFTLGIHFPIWDFIGIKTEVSQYNDVTGADIRQFTVGVIFELKARH